MLFLSFTFAAAPAIARPANIEKYLTNDTFNDVIEYMDYLVFSSEWPRPKWCEFYFKKTSPHWFYGDAVMNTALNYFYQYTNDKRYLNFLTSYYDYYVAEDYSIIGWTPEKHSLDDITPGRPLFDLINYTSGANDKESQALNERYRIIADILFKNLDTYPRTDEGSFWHRDPNYVNEVWLDGLYMAMPFYTRYGTQFLKNSNYDDILLQFRNCRKHVWNSTAGLYYHGYARKQIAWADPVTGHSACFWARGDGWFLNALLDVADYADPRETAFVSEIRDMAKEHLLGFISHIEPETQMIFEVVDVPEREGNYAETSGSSMLSYAILRAVSQGILDKSYIDVAVSVFNGICRKYLSRSSEDGVVHLHSIVWQAGLGQQGDFYRDGTFDYYVSSECERLDDDAKGSAFFLMAFLEICKLAR